MRTLSFWTGPRAAKANLVSGWWASVCPGCERACKEDIPHILLECSLHADIRYRLIRPVVEWIAGTGPALSREELAAVILGGQAGGVALGQQWLGVATQSVLEGNDAPFLRVAEFLQDAMPQRMGRLWGDRIPQCVLSGLGVVLPEDYVPPAQTVAVVVPPVPGQRSQRPNG